jgi:predicted nucleotidyltransferase
LDEGILSREGTSMGETAAASSVHGEQGFSEALLSEAVSRILAVGEPQRIVLFGSRARGDARPESDVDLLIVEDSKLPRYKRAVPYLRALTGLLTEKDLVVWTPEEVREWERVPNAFITTALREGRTLYAR